MYRLGNCSDEARTELAQLQARGFFELTEHPVAPPAVVVPVQNFPHRDCLHRIRDDAADAPEAVHIPLGELAARYTELGRDRPLFVICRSGNRSAHAAHALTGAG